jgi:hypothetical protein
MGAQNLVILSNIAYELLHNVRMPREVITSMLLSTLKEIIKNANVIQEEIERAESIARDIEQHGSSS